MFTSKIGINTQINIIKGILLTYVSLCLIIAGLNYGLAPNLDRDSQLFIESLWHLYENGMKVVMIIVLASLSISISSHNGKRNRMRKANIIALSFSALFLHLVFPYLLHNQELYMFSMPLPWSSIPIQLNVSQSVFRSAHIEVWKESGINLVTSFFLIYSLCVYLGTFLFGRRFHCSSICMFNGFAGELFSDASPIKKKSITHIPHVGLFRIFYFCIALVISSVWTLSILGLSSSKMLEFFSNVETIKYLLFELLLMMFFWIVFTSRGYCHLCPLGTFLSWIAHLGGQQIRTDNTQCIECNRCNKACPMDIDIAQMAKQSLPVKSTSCVGCGHCVDACPTQTLSYSTHLLSKLKK